jgi:hypothetical protein
MGRVIEGARRKITPKQGQCEKGPKNLQRNVTHSEKMIFKLLGRLQKNISELGKLRDRKKKALREVHNINTARKLSPQTHTNLGTCPSLGL